MKSPKKDKKKNAKIVLISFFITILIIVIAFGLVFKDKKDKDTKNHKVLVEGINVGKKHTKPNAANQAGGIVSTEAYIDVSNVMYLKDGKATRIGFEV